jgi:tRNA threonylcarbamoyladenosine biosynthesis protein TsaB
MSFILHIETATKVCSVALSGHGKLISLQETNTEAYSHSGMLTVFIQNVVREAGISMHELSAVAVSMGPGSYTGLRIGVSAAKGLCYGLDIPLIGIGTLDSMVRQCRDVLTTRNVIPPEALEAIYCPMIDARRMEVYFCLYDHTLRPMQEVQAAVIGEDSFSEILDSHKLLLFGDGAEKCKTVLTRVNAVLLKDIYPSAKGMIAIAEKKFLGKEFEDVAYFEPFYLKNFVAGIPKVKGLYKEN